MLFVWFNSRRLLLSLVGNGLRTEPQNKPEKEKINLQHPIQRQIQSATPFSTTQQHSDDQQICTRGDSVKLPSGKFVSDDIKCQLALSGFNNTPAVVLERDLFLFGGSKLGTYATNNSAAVRETLSNINYDKQRGYDYVLAVSCRRTQQENVWNTGTNCDSKKCASSDCEHTHRVWQELVMAGSLQLLTTPRLCPRYTGQRLVGQPRNSHRTRRLLIPRPKLTRMWTQQNFKLRNSFPFTSNTVRGFHQEMSTQDKKRLKCTMHPPAARDTCRFTGCVTSSEVGG